MTCAGCGATLSPKRPNNRYCSEPCRDRARWRRCKRRAKGLIGDGELRGVNYNTVTQLAVMTFSEIGAALGISTKNAQDAYLTGMRKLRAQPEALNKLRQIAADLDGVRP